MQSQILANWNVHPGLSFCNNLYVVSQTASITITFQFIDQLSSEVACARRDMGT